MKYTGKIITLAFPDTFVRFPDEYIFKFFPLFRLGKDRVIKAGHAAMVLVENATGIAEYYDFGRYITPFGKGRVRSAVTDAELEIPFQATFTADGGLQNLEKFLLWLADHPEKTHGEGRMVASICDTIDYDKAKGFLTALQNQGSVPYLTFGKEGTNCSRIVTDTIIAATDQKKIQKTLLRNKKFTPSPLGNVEKSSQDNKMYQVIDGVMSVYQGSVFKENITNYFDKKIPDLDRRSKEVLPASVQQADFLTGIGSCAYFKLEDSSKEGLYTITRYTEQGICDFKGLFKPKNAFNPKGEYHFVYDSNCKYCHIEQQGVTIRFDLIEKIVM